MEPLDFVNGVRKSVIEDNLTTYKEIFEKTSQDQASDPYWKDALALFSSLDEKQKTTLYKIIRQVQVDNISTMFGILDGTSYVDSRATDLKLTLDDSGQVLNGELQDLFLEIEEDQ